MFLCPTYMTTTNPAVKRFHNIYSADGLILNEVCVNWPNSVDWAILKTVLDWAILKRRIDAIKA